MNVLSVSMKVLPKLNFQFLFPSRKVFGRRNNDTKVPYNMQRIHVKKEFGLLQYLQDHPVTCRVDTLNPITGIGRGLEI